MVKAQIFRICKIKKQRLSVGRDCENEDNVIFSIFMDNCANEKKYYIVFQNNTLATPIKSFSKMKHHHSTESTIEFYPKYCIDRQYRRI